MKSKKGVSPVIAEVLLMGIAVSAVISGGIFLQGTMDDIQDTVDDRLNQEDKQDRSSIDIEFGINGSNGYFLADVRNTGSRTLVLEEDSQKKWNAYLDNIPIEWNYTQGSSYNTESYVTLDPQSGIRINTTQEFPASGETQELEITGPYNVRSTFVCFSYNGGCEN